MKINIPTIVGALAAMSTPVKSLSLRGLLGRDGDERTVVDDDEAKYAEERILANLAAPSAAVAEDEKNEDGDRRGLQWIADCSTVAYFHPVYTAGWSGGYCAQTTGCNAPSFLTNLECCDQAYVGQSPATCKSTAGIAPTPPAPTPGSPPAPPSGGGVWYPDYSAQWAVGKCLDTLPLPPYGSRPLYTTQLECCKGAYAGQTSSYCIKNLVNAPTSSPSTPPTPKPSTGPTTSKPTGVPSTTKPTGIPTFGPTTGPTTLVPTGGPTTLVPTGGPTTLVPTAVPTTAAPTTTQYGAMWYPNYNAGYCSNKLPLPVNGAAPFSDSKANCCNGNYNWRYAQCMALGP